MGNPSSFTEIKRHVGGTAQYPAELYLFEHDGAMWASNKFWVTSAERVAPLLERFNLDPRVPGAYQVNGTVHVHGGGLQERNIGKHLDPALYPVAMVPCLVAGAQAYVQPDRAYLAAHQTADGAFLGLGVDDLEWLSRVSGSSAGDDLHYGIVRLMTSEPVNNANRAVALVADVIRTITPGGPNGHGRWTDAVREPAGVRVVGIIASVKLGTS